MDFSQFGASGAVVVVVFIFLKYMREEAKKRDITYEKVAKALDGVTSATKKNTLATASADQYLRQRNGRDAEFQRENIQAIKQIPTTMQEIANNQATAIINAVNVREQHVEHQTVTKSTIKDETVENETIKKEKK